MRSIFICILLVSLFSCNDAPFYTKSYSFKNNSWERNVKPKFIVDIKDTTLLYDFIVTLRTTTSYKYNNLWIFFNTTLPNGSPVREPIEIKTCYPDGSWIGKKTGSMVEHIKIFKRKKMPSPGKYKFVLEQGITEKLIDEVVDISFEVKIVK